MFDSDVSQCHQLGNSDSLQLGPHHSVASAVAAAVAADLLAHHHAVVSEPSIFENTRVKSEPSDMQIGLPPAYPAPPHYHHAYESALLHHAAHSVSHT
jgi:hypothetical protein